VAHTPSPCLFPQSLSWKNTFENVGAHGPPFSDPLRFREGGFGEGGAPPVPGPPPKHIMQSCLWIEYY